MEIPTKSETLPISGPAVPTPIKMPPLATLSCGTFKTHSVSAKLDAPINNPPLTTTISDEAFFKRFKRKDAFCDGNYGTVVQRARDCHTQTNVIVKSFLRKHVLFWTDEIPTEIDIMKSISHKNLAPMLESFESNDNFRMIMLDTGGQDLTKYLPTNIEGIKPPFPWIAREVALGLQYLHENCSVVHQDIKLENVIISKQFDEYKVQIIDFGAAKRYSKGKNHFIVDAGTHLYSCKERYTKYPIMGPEADIFSFGVFLYVIYFDDKFPFPRIDDIKSSQEVWLPKVLSTPKHSAFREMLVNTLTKMTVNRWTIDEVVSSEWMKQNGFNGLLEKDN